MTTTLQCPACAAVVTRHEVYGEGTISLCSDCGLQWATKSVQPIGVEDDPTRVHDHYMDAGSLNPATYGPYRDFFNRLLRVGRPGGRVLDLGCGNGRFVEACLMRGFDAHGVEIDMANRARMGDEVRRRVTFCSIEEYAARCGTKYDIITFWDAFEHLADPFGLLPRVADLLAPGGIVFVRVNNVHDIFNIATKVALTVAPALGRRLLFACFNLPQHHWNFSRRAVTLMLGRAGWEVVALRATETPAGRLTDRALGRAIITTAYLANRLIGGGKIGEYWIRPIGSAITLATRP